MRITVTFSAHERLLEAALYLPDIDSKDPLPALLFEGSMTGATSKVTEFLAQAISRHGYACMVLDHGFYGDDETAPAPWESPAKRVEDIKAALHFLEQQESVDREKIIGVGVSVGAEFLARAIRETEGLCKGLVMIEGPFDDAQNYIGHVSVPTVVIDESHMDAAIDETVLWIRTMWDAGRQWPSRDSTIDWSIASE